MKKIILACYIAFVPILLIAQTDTTIKYITFSDEKPVTKKGPRVATITLLDGIKQKGILYQLNDSQVVLLENIKGSTTNWKKPDFTPLNQFTIPTDQINTITFKKKNAGLKGMLIGMGIGIFTGAVIGFASGDDEITPYNGDLGDVFIALGNAFAQTAGEKALTGAAALGTGGALVGLVVGSVAKKKFTIGGKKEKVRDLHAELIKRKIITQ